MNNFHSKTLVLFFTPGISLVDWEKVGNLSREIIPYQKMISDFGFNVSFITYGGKKDLSIGERFLGNKIKILPQKKPWPKWIYVFLIPYLYKKELRRADFYKTNQMAAAIPAILAKFFYHKKLVIRCGYEWLDFLRKEKVSIWKRSIAFLIEKIAYQQADKIILTSEKDKLFVQKTFQISASKIKVISNYIDTNLFKPNPEIKKKKGRVIFVGRLEKQKNLFSLIEALVGLPIELILIGQGSLKEQLFKLSQEKSVKVIFKKNLPNEEISKELNKAELFILPSFYEGCPKVLLEAMACGLPCIGTNVEGIKEIIQHKENGFLCETDANSIRNTILELIHNEELKNKISQNARKTILEKFSLEKILEKEIMLYKNL